MQLFSSLRNIFKPSLQSPPRSHLLHGIKTGLACLMAHALTTWFNLELGYWAAITAVIVMQVYVADSIRMCLYRFTGTAIGAALGAAAIFLLPDTPVWIGVSIFLTTALCSSMTFYNVRYKMAAITVVIVITASIGAPDRLSYGTARVIEIVIGVFCAFLVSVLVFPERMIDVLKKRLAAQVQGCADKYDELLDAFLEGQKPVDAGLMVPLTGETWKNHELFNNIKSHEYLIYKSKIQRNLATVIATLDLVTDHLRSMTRTLNACPGNGGEIIMARELLKLKEASQKSLRALAGGHPQQGLDQLKESVLAVEKKMMELRSKGATFQFDLRKIVQVYSFCHSMLNLAEDLIQAAEEAMEAEPATHAPAG